MSLCSPGTITSCDYRAKPLGPDCDVLLTSSQPQYALYPQDSLNIPLTTAGTKARGIQNGQAMASRTENNPFREAGGKKSHKPCTLLRGTSAVVSVASPELTASSPSPQIPTSVPAVPNAMSKTKQNGRRKRKRGRKKWEGGGRKKKDKIKCEVCLLKMLYHISQEATEHSEANLASVQRVFREGAMLTSALDHIPAYSGHTVNSGAQN